MPSITDLNVDCFLDSRSVDPDLHISLFGTALHETADAVVDHYVSSSTGEFLADQKRRACGNYVIVDARDDIDPLLRVVTAPGYAGGFIDTSRADRVRVSTELSDIIETYTTEELSFDAGALGHYLDHSSSHMLPISGLLSGVDRLAPGCIYDLLPDGDVSYRTFMTSKTEAPESFRDALAEAFASLSDRKVVLLLSGGIDSTAFLVGLLEHADPSSLRTVSVDMGPELALGENSVYRAEKVTESLGVEHEIISFDQGWIPDNDQILEPIAERLDRCIINPWGPQHALHGAVDPDEIVLLAQNMDALITVDMWRDQPSLRQNVRRRENLVGKTRAVLRLLLNYYLPNFQHTDIYLSHTAVRALYLEALRPVYANDSVPDPNFKTGFLDDRYNLDPSFEGILAGLLETGIPNHRYPETSSDRLSTGGRDVTRLNELIGEASKRMTVDATNFLNYAANAQKKKTTSTIHPGASVMLPVMWGPLASYFLGRRKGLREVVQTKYEVFKYIESMTGSPYHDIAYESAEAYQEYIEQVRDDVSRQEKHTPVLAANIDCLSPETSTVIASLSEGKLKTRVTEIYERNHEHMTVGDVQDMPQGHRIVNLERLLSNAQPSA